MSDNTGFFRNLAGLANDYVDTKRRRLKGTPKTRAESGGSKDSLSWDGQEASREDLRHIKKIRESGGVVARMIRAKALLSFGTGIEFHVENNDETLTTTEDGDEITLEEWLEDEFDDVEEIVLDIGEDAIWYPYGAAELVETKTDGFSHVEPVEPWTLQPTTDERGNIVQWDQEIRSGGKRITEPFDPEEIKHFVINKSSARDKTGISEVLRSEEEIESYRKNQAAMRNAIEMHGYPEWHVQAGVSGSTPVNDQDLRRVINMVERSNGSGDTVTATGPDVEFNRLDPGDIMLEEITSNDLQKLALALGLPIEAVDFGSEGLGSGEQSKVRRAIMELDIIATQRAYMSQWVDKIIRPVVKDYSPFDSTRNLEMRLEDPLTSNEDMASLINDVGEYMTANEARAKLGLPEQEGLDDEYGAPGDDGEGGEEGGDAGFFRDGRALAVPDNAVSIDNPSEAPDGAQIVEGDRGGLYYVPSGGDGDGSSSGETIDSAEDFNDAIPTPDEGAQTLTDEQRQELTETTAAALRGGVGASEVVDSLQGGEGFSVDRIAHNAAREVSAQPVNGFDTEASVLSRGSDFPEEAESVFSERFGEEAAEEMGMAKDGWRTDMFNEETAAIHQLAADITGNEQLPDGVENVHDIDTGDAPVSDETAEQIREQSIDALREVYGDEMTLYRGLSPGGGPSPAEATNISDQLLEAKENGDSVDMEHRSAESWSANPQYATRYAFDDDYVDGEYVRNEGAVVETTVPVEDAVMASMGGALASQEDEVVVAHEESAEYGPDNIHGFEEMDNGLAAEKLLETAAERATNE